MKTCHDEIIDLLLGTPKWFILLLPIAALIGIGIGWLMNQ